MKNEIEKNTDKTPAKAGAVVPRTFADKYGEMLETAAMVANSTIVPEAYLGNAANCFVAMEIASKMDVSFLTVMQNLDVIHGRPSWSSKFIISALNTSGLFGPLRWEWVGEKKTPTHGCRLVATRKADGLECVGTTITWAMVKAEGWLEKRGSKWQTMPEQMFMYRAASFFAKVYAPEVTATMSSTDELKDAFASAAKIDRRDEVAELFAEVGELMRIEDREAVDGILKDEISDMYPKAIELMKGVKADSEAFDDGVTDEFTEGEVEP